MMSAYYLFESEEAVLLLRCLTLEVIFPKILCFLVNIHKKFITTIEYFFNDRNAIFKSKFLDLLKQI